MNKVLTRISAFGNYAQKNIDKMLFGVACFFVVMMCFLGLANKVAVRTLTDYLAERRQVRDQEVTDLKATDAKLEGEIVALKAQVEALKK